MPNQPQKRLFAATGNLDKLREIREVLGPLGFEIVALQDFKSYTEPEETGATLAENALIKAREGYRQTGLPSLADDSGLEVEALGGEPGVYSSRYAGPGATYSDNCLKLLEAMREIPTDKRSARFSCVIALVGPEGEICCEGEALGTILKHSSGKSGFGYDPIFFSPDLGKTFAEATETEKNSVSHRGWALREMAEKLKQS